MLFRVFHKNTLVPFALLPFLMGLLWAKALLGEPQVAVPFEVPMPLTELLWGYINPQSKLLPLISLFLAFLTVYALNRLNTKYVLLRRQSVLPGVVFLVFVSGYTVVQALNPVWFFTPLFAWALHKLFQGGSKSDASVEVFNMMFLVSVGSLFFARGLYWVPLLWCGMIVVNIMSLRNFLASFIGLVLPYLLTFGAYFYMDRHLELVEVLFENLLSPAPVFTHNGFSKFYNGVMVLLILLGLLATIRQSSSFKILTRRYYRVMLWLVVYAVFLAATPFFSMELIPVLGVSVTIILSNYFEALKPGLWQNLFFYIFIGMTFLAQLFV
ncbi:MAG: hypothetical protein JXR39_04585 [Marinilabiliaceae bacterium]|nr:hypothetical protein [Marinilabiliaceae bacterium]